MGPIEREILCLVLEDTAYDLLVSRPLMKEVELNLHFDDSLGFGALNPKNEAFNAIQTVEDLEKEFPN